MITSCFCTNYLTKIIALSAQTQTINGMIWGSTYKALEELSHNHSSAWQPPRKPIHVWLQFTIYRGWYGTCSKIHMPSRSSSILCCLCSLLRYLVLSSVVPPLIHEILLRGTIQKCGVTPCPPASIPKSLSPFLIWLSGKNLTSDLTCCNAGQIKI